MSEQTKAGREQFWATGGAFGALLASSCCLAPLMLVTLGISGAWIGNLTMLEPYKWVFIAIAVVFLGLGFRQVYFRSAEPCEDGIYCARPETSLIVKSALWLAAALIFGSATVDWWAPLFY
ncbi:mercuric transporter MerT family protein [Sphingorhabdus sp. SMR4y]|uniref:mercuric transporter MerT family protein n=1 Tax=Sphingorhabdus sp. SMR4y TaxID=2584094 RepID=UPI000B5C884D|nr:mercuric transporter MerT family protein [Sphingorhabdus sp. SMR4y]ASK89653.1 MerT mercuric transport protein [Sphingorhabdus sp. SMR4y]